MSDRDAEINFGHGFHPTVTVGERMAARHIEREQIHPNVWFYGNNFDALTAHSQLQPADSADAAMWSSITSRFSRIMAGMFLSWTGRH